MDFFDANPWLWGSQSKRVRYVLSRMDGPAVASFALTYRKKMMGTLELVKAEGYEFWHTFAEQAILQFGPTYEAEKALQKMTTIKYHRYIIKFRLKVENLNIHAKVSGVAWREMVKGQLPEEAFRRLSMDSYDEDDKWKAEVLRAT